jgi:type II secretory ATPase GspE/PulE/Tfp pilus assembly ATPase PilB-like protein
VLDALRKWMKLVGDNALAAKGLLGIMNQRLIRKLCAACKEPYKPDAASLKKMNMPADQVLHRQPQPQFDKHGNPIICQACQGTGYSGLTAIFDVVMADDGLREVIRRAKSLEEIKAYIVQRGGLALQQQALAKVLAGTTSIAEVKRATAPPAPVGAGAKPAAKPAAPKAPPPGGSTAQTAR